jgi:hypothetical protein
MSKAYVKILCISDIDSTDFVFGVILEAQIGALELRHPKFWGFGEPRSRE